MVASTALISFGAPAHAASDDTHGDGASAVTNTLPTVDKSAVGPVRSSGWDKNAGTPATKLAVVADVIRADDLWSRGVDGSGIGVALIDSGVVPVTGLDGDGKVINGADLSFDSQSDSTRYLDGYGHGTHMAGIIAGNDGTKNGFRGVAPGAHIVNVKVGAADGAVDVSQVIAAIDWTVQHRNDPGLNIRVISLSYGTESLQNYRIDPLTTAVESAGATGSSLLSRVERRHQLSVPHRPGYRPLCVGSRAADIAGTSRTGDDRSLPSPAGVARLAASTSSLLVCHPRFA